MIFQKVFVEYLKNVSFADTVGDQLCQNVFSVQSERSRQVRHPRIQKELRQEVGALADRLALQIPAADASAVFVACSSDDVKLETVN